MSPTTPAALPVVETSLFTESPVVLRTSEVPKPRRERRAPKVVRALQPGDPACWAWQHYHFSTGPDSIERAVRALRAWHKGRCGICGEVPRLLVVDHDHNTALIRGLLCDDCNKREGVSRVKDDVFARWRAVPSAAILGIAAVYASSQTGVADPMPFKVTGPPFLPEWAPPHLPWPPSEAMTTEPVAGSMGRPLRSVNPHDVWSGYSADQRTALRVCFPDLAEALDRAS